MARFLLTVWPFPGHLYPSLAVAHVLRLRGHTVGFYSGEAARDVIDREGFAFFPTDHVAARLQEVIDGASPGCSGHDDAAFYERLTARYSLLNQRKSVAGRIQKASHVEWVIGTVPQQVADLEAIIERFKPDVLICDPTMWGPYLVLHERRGIAVAILSFFAGCFIPGPDAMAPSQRPRRWPQRVAARLGAVVVNLVAANLRGMANRVRADFNLPRLREPVSAHAGRMPLYLVTTTPEYDYQRRDLPSSVRYVGACSWDRPRQDEPPDWLDALPPDRPIIYVTEGTSHVTESTLLQAAARGLAEKPLYVVLTTGRQRDPARLGLSGLAANMRAERFVAHSDLFPRLSVVVTNGGSGTVQAALAHGLPLVIVPMEWDQFENAQRVVEGGAGIRLDVKDCTPQRLSLAVQRVLDDPAFRANARRLGAASARYGGPERAAELLEDLALAGPASGLETPTGRQDVVHENERATVAVEERGNP